MQRAACATGVSIASRTATEPHGDGEKLTRLLIVAHFVPYPPNHGSAADIWGQIRTLKSMGCTIDLVATDTKSPTPEAIEAITPMIRKFWYVPRDRGLRRALTLRPFQLETRRGLRYVPLEHDYDAVILQTEYVADILQNERLRAQGVILRIQNNEVRYYRDLAKCSTGMGSRLFFLLESLRFRNFLTHFRGKCDQLWFISDYERQEHAAECPSDASKSIFLPIEVDVASLRQPSSSGASVLFVGALNRPMNRQGLQWYLREVHPKLRGKDGYRLVIVGHTGGQSIEWLSEACDQDDSISIHPDASNLLPFYEDAAVFVNPIFAGTGMKLKTIHALAAGVPEVTTTIGTEGTGLRHGDHLLIADTASEFADSVTTLLADRNRGIALTRAAQAYLRRAYDQKQVMETCLATIADNCDSNLKAT